MRKSEIFGTCSIAAIVAFATNATAQSGQDAENLNNQQTQLEERLDGEGQNAEDEETKLKQVIVTARRREETLTSVPVAVTAFTIDEIERANLVNLAGIGDIAPNVIISNFRANGGGSIAIRGISSPATALGFEQAVSVSIDGVQTSSGFLAQLGFFDVQQVEVLKGPQALLFGKNSPAGVISLSTAQPTDTFEASLNGSYEFIADEMIVDGVVSGPITDKLSARLALRGRHMKGWLYNDARPIADNPFIAGPDEGLPGAHDSRVGDEEFIGRVTLAYEPTENIDLNLKVTHNRARNDGGGLASQNIGPCVDNQPRVYGVADPYGECEPDDRLTNGDTFPAAAHPAGPADGQATGELDATLAVLQGSVDLGSFAITSITGYSGLDTYTFGSFDQTTLAQVVVLEDDVHRALSQEIRLETQFDGPLNFMAGGYYQSKYIKTNFAIKLNDAFYNPATDLYYSVLQYGSIDGDTVSVFAQGLYDITDHIELAAGARWTREEKVLKDFIYYGNPSAAFQAGNRFDDTFKDENVSPEVTLSWRPTSEMTVFAAYRTGYKSGGYNLTSPIQANTTIGDIDFGSEKAEGFEIGAKGFLLDGRLFFDTNAYAYTFSDLQVNAYDPARIAYTVSNAAEIEQKGVEFQANFDATDNLRLTGNIAYNHNRFTDFEGQCYSYTFPAGDTTSPAPPNCSFIPGTRTLQQDFKDRAPARSPDWTGKFGAVYTRRIGPGLELELHSDAIYSDSYYAAETAAPSTFQEEFWRLNAGINLISSDRGWSIGLSGRNLTDEYYLLFASDRTGGVSAPLTVGEQRGVVSRGRQIVLQAGYQF